MGKVKRHYVKVRREDGEYIFDLPSLDSHSIAVMEFTDEGNVVAYVRPMTKKEMELQTAKARERWAK